MGTGAIADGGNGAGAMPMTPMMDIPGNEMGMDPDFGADHFYALETMIDGGLFSFPLSFENLGFNATNMQF